jgi:hypothetical protein
MPLEQAHTHYAYESWHVVEMYPAPEMSSGLYIHDNTSSLLHSLRLTFL